MNLFELLSKKYIRLYALDRELYEADKNGLVLFYDAAKKQEFVSTAKK